MNIKEITLNEPLYAILVNKKIQLIQDHIRDIKVYTATMPAHKRMISAYRGEQTIQIEINFLETMFIINKNRLVNANNILAGHVINHRLYPTRLNKSSISICGYLNPINSISDAEKAINWYYTSIFQELSRRQLQQIYYNGKLDDEIYDGYNYQFPQLNL